MQVEVTCWPGSGWCLLIKYIPAWQQSSARGGTEVPAGRLHPASNGHCLSGAHVVPKPQPLGGLFPEGNECLLQVMYFMLRT